MKKPATDTLLNRIKREAKQQTSPEKTYMQALNELSAAAGYADWRAIDRANRERKTTDDDDIPLDPVLPRDFDDTPNEERSKRQLDKFWLMPFVQSRDDGTFEARCLDGGCWDRPTWYGIADSLDGARALARTKLGEWMAFMARPVVMYRGDGLVDLILTNHRPDEERPKNHATGVTLEQAQRLLTDFDQRHAAPKTERP